MKFCGHLYREQDFSETEEDKELKPDYCVGVVRYIASIPQVVKRNTQILYFS